MIIFSLLEIIIDRLHFLGCAQAVYLKQHQQKEIIIADFFFLNKLILL